MVDSDTLQCHRRNGLIYATVSDRGDSWVFHPSGVLRSAVVDLDRKLKRGWDGTLKRVRLEPGGQNEVETIPPDEALSHIEPVHREAVERFNSTDRQRVPPWNSETYRDAEEQFQKIYGDVPILPPDQYRSLLVNLTEGCSYNECSFCDFYRDVNHRVRSEETFKAHVDEVVRFFDEVLDFFNGVFLGAGDALSAPVASIVDALRTLRTFESLPAGEISCFGQGNVARNRSLQDLERVSRRGLDRAYLGLETGSNQLLENLRKPISPVGFNRTVRMLKEAGIDVGCIVLVGVGGRDYRDEHREQTLNVLNNLPLDETDRIFLSPLAEGHVGWSGEDVESLSSEELHQQDEALRQGLEIPTPVAHYDVESFVY